MGYIKIDLSTDNTNGDVDIKVRTNCTENELQVATANLMGLLTSMKGDAKIVVDLASDLWSSLEKGEEDGTIQQ